ncbi:hypothetical protein [Mesorhizobium sp. M0701]|uniref:hypothetical protein n=1 Tax=unclassified Mesorhizobium TaxID=325217 RepID=UPI00333BC003
MTLAASEQVNLGAARLRGQRHLASVGDPALGTLQIPADVRLKAVDALNREVRRIKRRLYFENAKLRTLKVFFQSMAALLVAIAYLYRSLSQAFR